MNNKLEEKIQSLSTEYIFNEALGSIFLLLISSFDYSDKISDYKINEDILEIKKQINNYIINLENILNSNKENRLKEFNSCFDLRNKIIQIYEKVYGYFASLNIASQAINDEIALRKYKEENSDGQNLDIQSFIKDCSNFLNSASSPFELSNYENMLLKCLPLKMTKDNYFIKLKNSLNYAFKNESKESIEISLETFFNTCAPETNQTYGIYFSEIAEALKDKKSIKPSELTDENLEKEYESFSLILDTLQEIEDYFKLIFNDINSLIIIFYSNFTFDELTGEKFEYLDIYHTVCEMLSNELNDLEKSALKETVTETLEKYFEPIIDKTNAVNKELVKLIEKINSFENISDDTLKCISSESFIKSTYYCDLNEEIFNFKIDQGLPPASKEYKESAFDLFIAKIKNHLEDLPLQTRKNAMKTLLYSLPNNLEPNDVLETVYNEIYDTSSIESKFLIIDKIGTVFNDLGFNYMTEENHSHEDCGCDHDHHHHEDCSCGHDHHHHEDCGCNHDHH